MAIVSITGIGFWQIQWRTFNSLLQQNLGKEMYQRP